MRILATSDQIDNADHCEAVTVERACELVRGLDENEHSMVVLEISELSNLMIGGGAGRNVVSFTENQCEFFELMTQQSVRPGETVTLTAGGQPGDFDARTVVTEAECLEAVRSVFRGTVKGLPWRKTV